MWRCCRLRRHGWVCRCQAHDGLGRGPAAVLAQVDRVSGDSMFPDLTAPPQLAQTAD